MYGHGPSLQNASFELSALARAVAHAQRGCVTPRMGNPACTDGRWLAVT